ncbi:MAG: DUF3015 family protein [Paraglaciecola sp.]|uniref:DUF3015 family protein n=1 Tax=Paraglaciecola sp. TaxID=1920173 RepID=UPI0032633CAF
MKKSIFGTMLLASLSSGVFAAGNGPNPFSDCGIGAALFKDTAWAAVTSNVIWDVGTTAVISATASPETCNGTSYQTAVFINETYESLEQNMIQGEGEYINTLATIMSCDAEATSKMTAEVRQNIASAELAIDSSRLEKAEDLYLNVMSTEAAKSCSIQS